MMKDGAFSNVFAAVMLLAEGAVASQEEDVCKKGPAVKMLLDQCLSGRWGQSPRVTPNDSQAKLKFLRLSTYLGTYAQMARLSGSL
jgi:hypothetical protein